MLDDLTTADLEAINALNAEDSLLEFIKLTWRAVEPRRAFVTGWAIEAILEHLEAVARGDIARLVINCPPGLMKSLSSQVFMPAWIWGPLARPEARFMCASYSAALTERDNGRMIQLMSNGIYRRHWGKGFAATDSRVKITNDKTGWKLATSVGGVGTGERADIIICLPYGERILTDEGWLPIGAVVDERRPVRVAGWSGRGIVWQFIEAYERNPGREVVEIAAGDAVLRCTADHPVWSETRGGYVEAGALVCGETVRTLGVNLLPPVRGGDTGQAVADWKAAGPFASMSDCGGVCDQSAGEQPTVRDVWEDGLSSASTFGADTGAAVLLAQVPRGGEPRDVETAIVHYVRWLSEAPEATFNVRVSGCHNYFAEGILVHNCDDALSVKEAESATVRETMQRWLLETIPTRLNDPERSAIVLIEHRTHEGDATGTWIANGVDFEHLMIPMEWDGRRYVTGIGWSDPRSVVDIDPDAEGGREWWRVRGELCFPERFPIWVVERDKKVMGSYASAGQFQQQPAPRGGGIIRRDWWQQWGPDDPVGIKFPPFDLVIGVFDGAYTTKAQNDPSALAVLGVFADRYPNPGDEGHRPTGAPKVMLVKCWSERLALHDAIRKIDETCRRAKVSILLVEPKATGLSVVQELHRLFVGKQYSVVEIDLGRRAAGAGSNAKVARAQSVVPMFENGMVYYPRTDWGMAAVDECAVFPRGAHDDQVDCIVSGLRWLRDNGVLALEDEWVAEDREAVVRADAGARAPVLYRT